ncbi:MAG: rod shape-determining protein MreC [Myxococcota bacterium]|nr:rod shape-determining protein MreC [Myxococcota bacterium]
MKELFRRYRNPVLVILLLAVPLFSLASARGERSRSGPVDRSTMLLLGMAQNQMDGALGRVASFWEDYVDLVDVKAENDRLKEDNARLREENTRLQGVLQENARLAKLVDFKSTRPSLELLPARVIAADVSPYFRVLRIRLDVDADKVEVGMPVVCAEGVVGQIESVASSYSDVMLAVDPRSRIDILTQSNRARGVLIGQGLEREYTSKISFLLRQDEVEEGDTVVTSGRGGRFPKELLVGRVSMVEKQEYGLYQTAYVEPSVDFSRLEEVFVVVNDSSQFSSP